MQGFISWCFTVENGFIIKMYKYYYLKIFHMSYHSELLTPGNKDAYKISIVHGNWRNMSNFYEHITMLNDKYFDKSLKFEIYLHLKPGTLIYIPDLTYIKSSFGKRSK
jgi:hypothetical protein